MRFGDRVKFIEEYDIRSGSMSFVEDILYVGF